MDASDEHTALVVDEYAAVVGLLSQKDILFLLASPLIPQEKETSDYIVVSSAAIIANGNCPLEKINELFHTDLQSKHHSVTVGGFLIEKLGIIPQSGETAHEQDLFFRILSVDQTRIKKIYIQNMNPKKEALK